MKFKLLSLSIVLLTFFNVNSQTTNQQKGFNSVPHQINPPSQSQPEIPVIFGASGERSPAADRYILDIKTLRTYFKRGKIPRNFPAYDTDLSFEDNKRLAVKWALNNKRLLTHEKRTWLTQKSKH
jgi:hypothetical protein